MIKLRFKKSYAYLLSLSICLAFTGCQTTNTNSKTLKQNVTTPPEQEATLDTSVTPDVTNEPRDNELPASKNFEDYTSMAELFSAYGIRFGTVIDGFSVQNTNLKKLITHHFNSLTAANEMKAYSLLDQTKSMQNTDGMPIMNYTVADNIAKFAFEQGISMRGHVLVWDAYMSDWFFREGYKNDGAYVDRETMLKRMEYYITEVINHFEENYPGLIYCWDVVNEAVGDNDTEYVAGDARHLRTMRSGSKNMFLECVGDDYVALAFLYAKNAIVAAGSDIKLYYNDYNTFDAEKCAAICELIQSVNTYAKAEDGSYRKLCDGIGMQGYIGGYGVQEGCLESKDIDRIHDAILTYADLGYEVQLTEMAVRNFDNSKETVEKHAIFYRDLFGMLIDINNDERKPLTAISIWSICDNTTFPKDSYVYKLNSPYGGLFTQTYKVKQAFLEVYGTLQPK